MEYLIAEFIPIFIIYFIISDFKNVILFGHTILGRLLAVLLIIFYTKIDTLLGILVCFTVIYFYQMDSVENMINMSTWNNTAENENQPRYMDMVLDIPELPWVKKFRQENCLHNQLKYKGVNVSNEMAEHVFPELNMENKNCNPCSNTCKISIIESKLKTEEKMLPTPTK